MLPAAPRAVVAAARTPSGWEAHLELKFSREAARTVLSTRRHTGPLRVQKALYPEGAEVCQAIVVHPPGGIVGGDSLAIDVEVGAGAHAQLTTPGAAKWYRSSGSVACARTALRLAPGAVLEWLPQESMLFDGARAAITLRVDIAPGARFIGWDVTCLGRTESGERFGSGALRQGLELHRADTPLYCERTAIDGGSPALQSGAMLRGAPVFGTLLAVGVPITDALLAACRDLRALSGDGSVTRLPEVLVGRYRGDSAHAARTYFANLWRVLRPSMAGRDAVMPRIFST